MNPDINNDSFDLDEIKRLIGDDVPTEKAPVRKNTDTTAKKTVEKSVSGSKKKKKKKKKKDRKKTAMIVIGCFCAAIVVLLGALAIYINSWLGLMKPLDPDQMSNPSNGSQYTLAPEDTLPTDFTLPTDMTVATSPVPIIDTPDIINIMLLGEDATGGKGRGLTDSMILCSINKKTNTISLISFLRDTYLNIPGYGYDRLNTAYSRGGIETFKETMRWNFGVEIDDVVMVRFDIFGDVVDILGGVDVELTQAEVNHLWKKYGYQLQVGMNHLTGEQAFNYARIRSIDSDFQRAQRQQKVLEAIFSAYRNKPLLELLDVTRQILPNLSSTMSNDTILSYVASLFPMLADCTLEKHRMPADGAWADVWVNDSMRVLVPDLSKCQTILKDIINP